MMMERAKTAPAPEPRVEKPTVVQAAPAIASPEERVQDLERRLELLDGGDGPVAPAPAAPAPTKPAAPPPASQAAKSNPLLKRIQAAQERARLAEQKEREAKAAAAAEAERKRREEEEARARAEEEARIARAQSALRGVAGRALEEKQRGSQADAQQDILAQLEGKAAPPPAAPPAPSVAPPPFSDVAPPAFAVAPPTTAPPAAAAATPGVPIMKSLDPPPPSFDSMKFPPPDARRTVPGPDGLVGHGMNSRALTEPAPAPPSFDFVEKQLHDAPPPPAEDFLMAPAPTAPALSPSAPPVVAEQPDHLRGILPVAPPPFDPMMEPTRVDAMPPPPSFEQIEQRADAAPQTQAEDDGFFDVDEDGNPLSLEQRQALMDEQRRLYESIMAEKAANDAAIAAANADAFDSRSSNAAAAAVGGGVSATRGSNVMTERLHAGRMDAQARAMDAAGTDAAALGTAAQGEEEEEEEAGDRRLVKIGANQTVALHGQDRTKRAIREGTAILVQCMNCQNWMQVTDTATLMFCPVCQVVSPVVKQNEVLTKEEAIQLTMDRKLAEKLQQEAYDEQGGEEGSTEEGTAEDRGFLGNLFGGWEKESAAAAARAASPPSAAASAAAASAGAQPLSWWDRVSSAVSYGAAAPKRDEMGVTRPPGAPAASQYPASRSSPTSAMASVNDSSPRSARQEETRGLLSPVVVDGDGSHAMAADANTANLPSGRVAESKPLFSCMMDSVSNAANAVFSTGEADGDGNVHGVDAGSLLVTNAGRGVGDGAGDYSRVPDRE